MIFEKNYGGYEAAAYLENDIQDLYDGDHFKGLPNEFLGQLKILIWYEPSKLEQKIELQRVAYGHKVPYHSER